MLHTGITSSECRGTDESNQTARYHTNLPLLSLYLFTIERLTCAFEALALVRGTRYMMVGWYQVTKETGVAVARRAPCKRQLRLYNALRKSDLICLMISDLQSCSLWYLTVTTISLRWRK